MKIEKGTTEHLFYGAAFLLAAAIRFFGLGSTPLSDTEANFAFQAYQAAHGNPIILGPQPGYLLLTSASFFLFSASDFLARFWPAAAGTLLAFSPILFRKWLGNKAAVILALAIALEPNLVAASRQADGRMLAIFGFVFALGLFLNQKPRWAGIFIGIGLLGGPTAWNGLLAVAMGLAVFWLTNRRPIETEFPLSSIIKDTLLWMVGTLLSLGTLFWFIPGGLSAFGQSLADYFQGWGNNSGASTLTWFIAWTVLSPLAFVVGMMSLLRLLRWRATIDVILAWLWVCGFGLFMLYPNRQVTDLTWSMIPFLALGARLASHLPWVPERKVIVVAYACLVGALAISFWLHLLGMVTNLFPDQVTLHRVGLLSTLVLLIFSFLLLGWGWSWRAASAGFVVGFLSVLLVYTLASSWKAAGISIHPETQVWVNGVYPTEQPLTLKVLGDVSEWNTGRRDSLELLVSGVDTPSLRWALRDYRHVSFVSQLAADTRTSVVITPASAGANLSAGATYTGQGLEWGQSVQWSSLLASDWMNWFFLRELPNRPDILSHQDIILWLRSDLFPGASKTAAQQ